MTKRLITLVAIFATLLVAMAAAFVSTSAQQSATPAMGSAGHPAHIHTGTCDTVGEVVFPLNDVIAVDSVAAPATPSLELASTPAAGATLQSTTTVLLPLDDILSGEHIINVHQSAEMIEAYVACGEITGEATDGTLTVELMELNESGVSGQAILTDNGEGETVVEINLTQSVPVMATPAA
jgi:hypothetical protein